MVTSPITVSFYELLYAVCERKVGVDMPTNSGVVLARLAPSPSPLFRTRITACYD